MKRDNLLKYYDKKLNEQDKYFSKIYYYLKNNYNDNDRLLISCKLENNKEKKYNLIGYERNDYIYLFRENLDFEFIYNHYGKEILEQIESNLHFDYFITKIKNIYKEINFL